LTGQKRLSRDIGCIYIVLKYALIAVALAIALYVAYQFL
jgi:hypothetical protein